VKALQVAQFGPPEVLRLVDIDQPHAGPGQIRVAVRAAGVNPIDWKIRSGAMQQVIPVRLPYIPGSDVAGVVDEVGPGVSGTAVGDAVFGFAVGGGAAEYAVLEHFTAKPASMGWAEAAGLPVAVETAVRALDLLGATAGQTLLINGATGGVGTAAVQFARARDITVIGTTSPANHDFLRSLGATPTAYGTGLVQRVRALAPSGVDRAFDVAGRGALPELIELTGSPDRVLTIADPQAQQYRVLFTSGGQRAYQAFGEAARLFTQGRFTLPIARTFPLADAPDAHRISEQGHVRGKLVLLLG
jgi:NADPH:quinone reductase-like Zn-dependent oxidoreductase